ncbi:hypothetical protein MRGA423_05530 [Mycobacterium tuberculosis RGTB423]|nr:hypothetical protein MRGA423_05530 [Mycobacterium tuberculosis RGTB423]
MGPARERSARPSRALGNGFGGRRLRRRQVIAVAVVVLSLGLIRVHPLLAVGLNIVAVSGLAPTLWGWRRTPVLRWFVLGAAVGVAGAWLALLALTLGDG